MSTSVEHPGLGIEPVVDTRWHRTLLSLLAGLVFAIVTLAYVYLASRGTDPTLFLNIAPFILVASVAGVGLPVYLAADMVHKHGWLQAAGASCLALFMGFLVFWSAALVVTTSPSGVRLNGDPVVMSIKFDPVAWRTDVAARMAMARDLCSSGHLRGMTPEQVKRELGDPAETEGPGLRAMCYTVTPAVGSVAATSTSRETMLKVLFSSQGKVASVAMGAE